MDYRNPVKKRDVMATLCEREGPDSCLDRLLLLFWPHYILRMVLIYNAQVHFRWLPFIDSKGVELLITTKKKDICKCKGKGD